MRKVFIDELPKKKTNRHGYCVDWKNATHIPIKFIYDDVSGILNIESVVCKYNQTYLNIKYNNSIKQIYSGNFKKGAIGRIIGIKDNSFLYEKDHKIVDCKRNITIIDRLYKDWTSHTNTKVYKCKCNICNYTWEVDEYHLLDGNGCPVCANKIVIPGVNDLGTMYPFTKKYFKNKEYEKYPPHSSKKIDVCCPYCNRSKKIMISNLVKRKSIGCICGDNISYPNKFIFNFFLQLNNQLDCSVEREYRPKWSNGRIYDIYFVKNNKKYIVEMDGGFHRKVHTKSNLSLDDVKNIDLEKDCLANLNGYEMIRIDSYLSNKEYLRNNIQCSKLSKIFDLSKINWDECEIYALNNLVKEISDYSKENPDMCVTDICKIFHISDTTTRRYLHIGNKYGWCDYDFNKFQKKRVSKPIKVIQYDLEGNFIKEFSSIKEAEKETKANNTGIINCCKGRQKTAGGFIWRYADDMENNTLEAV